MERTLITKSPRLRELSQWTAATTLVAAGALALFSATTLEKLSGNGDVAIDLQAFKKLGATSLALGRIEEEELFAEETRLLENAAFAGKESLPSVRTAFKKIRVGPAKGRSLAKVEVPSVSRILSGSPVVLSSAVAREIADLERVTDTTIENQVLARLYRNLRVRFVAAVESIETKDYPAESIAIARAFEAREYDSVPELDESLFSLPSEEITIAVAPTEEEESLADELTAAEVETAPSRVGAIDEPALSLAADSIDVSASSTADPAAMREAKNPVLESGRDEIPTLSAIATPHLDLMPEVTATDLTTTQAPEVSSHENEVKMATGPPVVTPNIEIQSPSPLQAKSTEALVVDAAELGTPDRVTSQLSPPPVSDHSADLAEYSKDQAAVFQGEGIDEDEESAEYSKGTQEDALVDGDFSSRPTERTVSQRKARRAAPPHVLPMGSGSRVPHRSIANTVTKDLGNGVRRDVNGITIHWGEEDSEGGKYSDTSLGGKVFVGKPGQVASDTAVDLQKSLKKFSFVAPGKEKGEKEIKTSQSSALSPEPAIDTKRCETARLGVEAFNTSAEKESLLICRRELSLEGSSEGTQARWWESHENETEHWPTLSFAKASETTAANRTPLLSTASIRILSAISKVNTHTGTGIIFGEVAKGLEIQLLGRSDSPIYLDAGMKVRDPSADIAGSRQFVFLNVEPGQPLLVVRNREKNVSGAIPLVVKSGMATHLKVREPKEIDLDLSIFDAASAKESRLGNLTAEVIGQPGKMGITDRNGKLKIRKVAVFEDFPVYLDLVKNEKSYKNRFRIRPATLSRGDVSLFFFDEKRVGGWLGQLSGGLSPYSGLIAGVAPASALSNDRKEKRHLKIGILEKKSSLIPERYLLGERDVLLSDAALTPARNRYIAVQIPEGPAIPTIVDGNGKVKWSELVYAQPGVINVVSPDL